MSNPLNRRGILGLFLGASASAATQPRMTLAQASAALGLPVGATISDTVEAVVGEGCATAPGPFYGNSACTAWTALEMIEQDHYKRNTREADMPPHITGKKSWSLTFKSHVHASEQRILDAYLRQLRMDEGSRNRLLSILGIPAPAAHTGGENG